MTDEMGNGTTGNNLEKFRALQITSLEEDEVEEDQVNGEGGGNLVENDDYEEEEEEEEEEQLAVTLGFVEKPKKRWSLLRQLFPSKAGGAPAWLDPIDLPSGRSCLCDICGEPLQFLIQVYAPLFEKESSFHCTLFVFMCQSMGCLLQDQHEQWKRQQEKASRSMKVFRCQLAHSNPFYSSEPPRRDGTDKHSGIGAALCNWCCTWKGDKVCSGCRSACYCSDKHQAMHWKSGHKNECLHLSISSQSSNGCPTSSSVEIQKAASNNVWPEYEIVNEDEPELDTEMSEDNGHANSLVPESHEDETVKSLLDKFEGDPDRKSLASFQERMSRAPEQVLSFTLRSFDTIDTYMSVNIWNQSCVLCMKINIVSVGAWYCRVERAKPLWPMSSGRPSETDVPKCSHCGSSRTSEFQILPQLLYYFGVKNEVESLDWATIAVYTCEASCEGSKAYKEEFVWVQLAS